jgi:hypothetical protein
MVETQSLDVLLAQLESWNPRVRTTRRTLEDSITVTEALVTRLRLAPDTCLYRSMARYALLRGHGVRATFCMGVNPPPYSSTGHAWVEDEDGPYRERIDDGQYVVTLWRPQ